MATWSERRKRNIMVLLIGALIILVGLPFFFFFYKSPTCSDNKQNGDETGIDCGGGCQKLCQAENLPIILKGDPQVIQVSSTTYAVVMHAENPNVISDILRAGYTFKIYQASTTIPLKVIEGNTYVPPGSPFAIFIGPLEFGENIPTRATFSFKSETLVWNKNITKLPELEIRNKDLTYENTEPRLSAEVRNNSLKDAKNVELTAFLYDEKGNIIGASKTFVDEINKEESAPIIFTWPAPFKTHPTSIEILIKILPDKSLL